MSAFGELFNIGNFSGKNKKNIGNETNKGKAETDYVIASDTLEFILEVCKKSDPYEFGALLESSGNVITNVIYLPGTDATEESVRFSLHMMPNMKSAGTIHSHPSGALRPSKQDLIFFKNGEVNIIVGQPYSVNSWKAFDRYGNPIDLKVVDYNFEDGINNDYRY
ncbi:MAG: metal-dependent protease of the PAD1/JAB1 superfamily [Methanosarcinaceae archaeon]|nr:metal-dependent protease of the PAD1/JAB1 superfamily [Methanosarcinaceae archaeon]